MSGCLILHILHHKACIAHSIDNAQHKHCINRRVTAWFYTFYITRPAMLEQNLLRYHLLGVVLDILLSGFQNNCSYQGKLKDLWNKELIVVVYLNVRQLVTKFECDFKYWAGSTAVGAEPKSYNNDNYNYINWMVNVFK